MKKGPVAALAVRGPLRKGFAVFIGLVGLIAAAQPAAAANGGTGTGTGSGEETVLTTRDDRGTALRPFCLEVTASTYVVPVTGAFTATDGTGTATYVGAATVTITTNENYYISPEGTYGNFNALGCDPATFGPADPVAATIRVTTPGSPPGAGVDCTAESTGTVGSGYFRVGTAFTVNATGPCIVTDSLTGVSASSGANTQHLFEGQLAPCLNPPVPCNASTLTGTASYLGANL